MAEYLSKYLLRVRTVIVGETGRGNKERINDNSSLHRSLIFAMRDGGEWDGWAAS